MRPTILLATIVALAAPLVAQAGDPPALPKPEGYDEAERLNTRVYEANMEASIQEVRELAAWRAEEAAKQREYAMVLARYVAAQQSYEREIAERTREQTASR